MAFWVAAAGTLALGAATNSLPAAPGEPAASFGPVMERKLRIQVETGEDRVLDLDTGKVLSIPTNIVQGRLNNPRPLLNWMVEEGADLEITGRSATNLLLHVDDGLLIRLRGSARFDALEARQVEGMLLRFGASQERTITLGVERWRGDEGTVLAFKTREGSIGLLEVLALVEEPKLAVRIRYKLVRGATGRSEE